jgi:O-antigen/teichoic acid export membrane protein
MKKCIESAKERRKSSIFTFFFKSKEAKNASWLIGGRIIQMILSFFIGILTARYLGPSNYGVFSYVGAYVTFFASICTLGINSVIIKFLLDDEYNQGITLGTSIVLRVISSFLSACMIVGIVFVVDKGDTELIIVSALCSSALIFQALDTINFWFQSKYKSRVTAIATLIGYIVVSAYRVVLIIQGRSVRWFAFASALDCIVIGAFLFIMYYKSGGQKLRFSWKHGKKILNQSYHYILSGMMVAIYAQTDKFMLKQMLDETEVGYYSLASTISTIWVFILAAIIDSMYPTIISLAKTDNIAFQRKNRQLYAIVFYVSCFVSLLFTLFGNIFIRVLYGEPYMPAFSILQITTWYVAFSHLGVARNAWVVSEGKQKYLKNIYFFAAIMNVILNFALIPSLGGQGAAIASLITQIFTSIILPFMMKELRPNAVLMLDAIRLKGVIPKLGNFK